MAGRTSCSGRSGFPTRSINSRDAASDDPKGGEALGNEGRVLHAGDAYGEIETFLDKVDKAVVQPHIENDIGLLGAEIDEALADVRIGKRIAGPRS